MTASTETNAQTPATAAGDDLDLTPRRHHPHRWRLSRAGFVDVWQYYDVTLDLSAGRGILRGPNGSGKSRALEMLLPFLLDADRRHMGAGVPVKLEDLMERGLGERTIRQGYLWLELTRSNLDEHVEFYTLGAAIRYSSASKTATVSYFTTPLRVGHDLALIGPDLMPLSRADLLATVGADRVVDSPAQHRDRVRTDVFGLSGEIGRQRFDGLLTLMHTLRHPNVGNQIEAGDLPKILAAALPPLSETSLEDAGQALDNLTSTRDDLERLRTAREHVDRFLDTYRRWLTGVMDAVFSGVSVVADGARKAQEAAHELMLQANQLDQDRAKAASSEAEHRATADAAEATVRALKDSPAYAALGQLKDRRNTVAALRRAASTALSASGHARDREQDVADAADAAADAISVAASALTQDLGVAALALDEAALTGHNLPAVVSVSRRAAPTRTDPVLVGLEQPSSLIRRPTPDTVEIDADLVAIRLAGEATADAAAGRMARAEARLAEARPLDDLERQIKAANKAATALAQQAEEDDQRAQAAIDDRDAAGRRLADAWAGWVSDAETVELLGDIDWAAQPQVGSLLTDPELLTGIDDSGDLAGHGIDLTALDAAAGEAAQAARDMVKLELDRLDTAEQAAQAAEDALVAERQRLENHEDQPPAGPVWQVPGRSPLWQLIDFAPQVSTSERAGLEAALAGAGLLTADLDPSGALVAGDGQLLVSAADQRARAPLSALIVPDAAGCEAAHIDRSAVTAVLDHIERESTPHSDGDAPSAAAVCRSDGSWRLGLLRGHHPVTSARHVGAAARAAARQARLANIAVELAQIATTRAEREQAAAGWQVRSQQITARVRRAPTSRAYTAAAAQATALSGAADRARGRARAAADAVDEQARAWQQAVADHRALCDHEDLPPDGSGLERIQQAAARAAAACRAVPSAAARLEAAVSAWQAALTRVEPRAHERDAAEADAATAWSAWETARREYETLEDSIGQDARDVQQKLDDAEKAHDRHDRKARRQADLAHQLAIRHATAAEQARQATDRTVDAVRAVTELAAAAAARLALPGVIGTLYPDPARAEQARAAFTGPALIDPTAASTAAQQLSGLLRRARTSDPVLITAFKEFGAAVGEMYDVAVDTIDGIHLYEVVDADGRRPLAVAAADLATKYETGRAALTEEEHRVFTDFVLGEVGEELRSRIGQAAELVAAMNRSLAAIRTSHGVQVKVAWQLDPDAGPDVVALERLVKTAQPVRTPAQDEELIGLLRTRVQAAADADPACGYAEHLRTALDYRDWHRVEVLVSAPHLGTQRVSKRSKLSQGETRTVSYVTLFAAVDAYLSGVADERALRVLLLDDAFAKVDSAAIAQMMGLLVRLDIDFLMTGHELWGCFPEVPAVDVYTVLRAEGGPAVVQHVHWDGRTRHVRLA